MPMLAEVIPIFEIFQSDWEDMSEDPGYEDYHNAIRQGLTIAVKYYELLDETDSYILAMCKQFSGDHLITTDVF